VTDRVAELEAKVAELTDALRRVEARLEAVERRPRPRAAVSPAAAAGAAEPPALDIPSAAAVVTWIGRTLLVLAGGFVLRALTDSGTLAAPLGVGLGLAYAGTWIALADLAGRSGSKWSAGFHGAAATLIGFPLLFEATFRFRLLSPGAAAALLAGLTAVALAVAVRRRLEGLAWLVSLAGAATAAAVALAPLGGRATFPTLYVVLLGVATLWLGYLLDWRGPRWPIAFAANGLVAVMALRAVAQTAAEGPAAAFVLQAALPLLYLGSIAARTLVLGRKVVAFEMVQTAFALAVGLGGAAYVAARTGGGAAAFGVVSVAAGLAAYGVAFAFVERRQKAAANFAFYTSVAIVLVLAGTALVLPVWALGLTWAALAVVAAGLARHLGRLTLATHGAAYGIAAAVASGLLTHAFQTAFTAVGEGWTRAAPDTMVAFVAGALAAWLAAGAAPRTRAIDRAPQLLLVATVACGAAGLAIGGIVPLLADAFGDASAGMIATVRTAVWVVGALTLTALGRRPGWVEAAWLAYPALAAIGVKILLEDLQRSRPATLFLAFALYGAALMVVARARHKPREGAGTTG
jgi:hypothetical protein